MKPVEKFEDLEYYEQDSGEGITYQFVAKPGTIGLMSSGRVRLKGPTTKALDTHDGWDQIYIILAGRGTAIVGDEEFAIEPGMVVRVPDRTRHGVRLAAGESMEYIYVNAFRDKDALARLMCEAGL